MFKGILSVLGIILKVIFFPLTILSRVGSVESQVHMDTNRQTEMQAQYKIDEVKRMQNRRDYDNR